MIDATSFESRFPLQETPETGRLPWVKNCAQACRLDWTREIVCLWSSGVGIYYSFLFGLCSKIRWLPMLTMMCQPWCSNCRSCPAGLQPRLKITRSSHILPSGHSQAWAQTLNMGATWRGTFTGGFVAFTVSNSNRTPFTSTSRLLCWPKNTTEQILLNDLGVNLSWEGVVLPHGFFGFQECVGTCCDSHEYLGFQKDDEI